MAVNTCWNCRNPVSGAVCPTCGARQTMSASPMLPSPQNPPAQPSVSQASMSVRQGPPMYVPGGQPGVRDYEAQEAINARYEQRRQPPAGNAPMDWQEQPSGASGPYYGAPGQPYGAPYGPDGAAGGWQQPVALIGQPASAQPAMSAPAASAGMGQQVMLAALFGLVAAVIGALVWAFFLNITKANFWYLLGVGLGFLVGFGVILGSRGQRHVVYMVLAGVLGLLCFVMALYFRLSLLVASDLGASSANVFALPFGFFSDVVKEYLKENPINYAYFILVPLAAVFTTVGKTARRIAGR